MTGGWVRREEMLITGWRCFGWGVAIAWWFASGWMAWAAFFMFLLALLGQAVCVGLYQRAVRADR